MNSTRFYWFGLVVWTPSRGRKVGIPWGILPHVQGGLNPLQPDSWSSSLPGIREGSYGQFNPNTTYGLASNICECSFYKVRFPGSACKKRTVQIFIQFQKVIFKIWLLLHYVMIHRSYHWLLIHFFPLCRVNIGSPFTLIPLHELHRAQCLKIQKEDKKIVDGWNVDFLYYYDMF